PIATGIATELLSIGRYQSAQGASAIIETSIKSHVIASGATGRYVSQPFSKPPPSATRPQLREGGYARRGGGSGRFGLRRGHLAASLPEAREAAHDRYRTGRSSA